MIEFLKNIFKSVNFKSDNEELNKLNKIIYSIIIICAVCFIGFILYIVIKNWPAFAESVRYNWNDSKPSLEQRNFK